MVRIGGFRKTQNRIRRQRARERFILPYQVGETILASLSKHAIPCYTGLRDYATNG